MAQNIQIRSAAKKSGVRLWEVAERWGVSEFTLCRRLRRELSAEDKSAILEIIKEIASEREEGGR